MLLDIKNNTFLDLPLIHMKFLRMCVTDILVMSRHHVVIKVYHYYAPRGADFSS